MSCECDLRVWPPRLEILAGASSLARQQFDFALLRAAMFDRARQQAALAGWSSRDRSDYGVMLLEMWAYAGEIFSIYDKAIADESYVRTAQLRPSLRALVDLLGYRPRPAIASTVELAAIADGARPIVLPVGTAFRSGSVEGGPPQVFEVVQPATIHPALNRWELATTISTMIDGPSIDSLLLDAATSRVGVDDIVLVELGTLSKNCHVRRVATVERVSDPAGRRLVRAVFTKPMEITAPVSVSSVRIKKTRRAASLKLPESVGSDEASFEATMPSAASSVAEFPDIGPQDMESPSSGPQFYAEEFDGDIASLPSNEIPDLPQIPYAKYNFVLDGVYREARTGQRAIVQNGDDFKWFRISTRIDKALHLATGGTSLFTKLHTNVHVTMPDGLAASGTATWSSASADELVVHVGLETAARVVGAARPTLAGGDALIPLGARAPLGSVAQTKRVLLRDAEGTGAAIGAALDFATPAIVVAPGTAWGPLASPVEAFGNVIIAERGETVGAEVIGSGDAARVSQTFALAKKPLTYVSAPSKPSGVASTLRIWVDGVEWFERDELYGASPTDTVFVVRIDDDEVAWVTFGDGVFGKRLPTGLHNVVARYRFGAGDVVPAAGSITQVARPVVGLRGVVGPIAATGGGARDSAESLRSRAPRSAMLLGRAISIDDMQVAALGAPGVRTARAEWNWDGVVQRPVVKVWVVGDANAPDAVAARLRGISDPTTPIRAAAATAIATTVTFDLELDPLRIASDVVGAARTALLDGILSIASLGIGEPVIRSQLVAAALDVPGVTGVRGITWNGQPFLAWAIAPGTGNYFDLGDGLMVTGS